jgi:AraC-like DNA-binding protein
MPNNPFERITVSKTESVSTIKHQRGATVTIENRFAYGVSFCISGKITYTHNGKKYVSDPSHAIFHPKGQSYTFRCDESGEFLVINFQCTEDFNSTEFYSANISSLALYVNDYNTLERLQLLKKSDSRIKSLAVLYSILSRLAAESQNQNINTYLATALITIENNLQDPMLDVTRLAEISGISEVYLRKLFSKTLGVSPKQYLIDLRMSKAKQLLKNTQLPITQISEKCGYQNIYHFSRTFKATTGYSPTEYRSKNSVLTL